jgi:Mn2+/Fe2+ NRAMP family transporter
VQAEQPLTPRHGVQQFLKELGLGFYAVIGVSIVVGLAFDFVGMNAVKMPFWSAILNRLLAPPLVVMVVLLTSDRKVMGDRANSRTMQVLG